MEAVEDESGVGAVVFDGLDIGAAHIATGPTDAAALVFGEVMGEELVDGRQEGPVETAATMEKARRCAAFSHSCLN